MSRSEHVRGWGATIGWVLAFVVLAALFWFVFQPWLVFWAITKTYDYIVTNVVAVSGLNSFLVKGITVFALIPFGWAVFEVVRLDLWGRLRGRSRATRTSAQLILIAYLGGYFLAMYVASRDSNFAVRDGQGVALKYCAETPKGLRCYDAPGVDREFGILLEAVTSDGAVARARVELGQLPRRIESKNPSEIEFFDRVRGGQAKVWYVVTPKGRIELYDAAGFDPAYGAALRPIDPQMVARYQSQVEADMRVEETARQAEIDRIRREKERADAENAEAQRRSYIAGSGDLNGQSLVMVLDANNAIDDEATAAIAAVLGAAGPGLSTEFVRAGLFKKAFNGDSNAISSLRLQRVGPLVVLAVKTSTTKPAGVLDKDLISAATTLKARVFRLARNMHAELLTVSAKGAGFSAAEAQRNADAEAVRSLAARLR